MTTTNQIIVDSGLLGEYQYDDEYRERYLANFNKYFLVMGYVKKCEKQFTLWMIVPSDVKYIIDCFFRHIDQWNTQYINNSALKISGNTLKSISKDLDGVACSKRIVKKGECYTWTVMMIKTSTFPALIGIIRNTDFGKHYQQTSQYYLLNCLNGKLMPGDRKYAIPFMKSGDIMQLKIDLSAKRHTVSFNINNKNFGVGFLGIYPCEYVLMAHIGNQMEIQII